MATTIKVKSLLFLWLAVCVLILATACTPSRQGGSPVAPVAQPTPAPVADPIESEAPTQTGSAQPTENKVADEQVPEAEVPAPAPSASSAPQAPTPEAVLDPKGMSADEIFTASQKLGEPSVGPRALIPGDKRTVFYSGAGRDLLRDEIEAREKSPTSRQSELDRLLAVEIGFVRLSVDIKKKAATISITRDQGDRYVEMEVRGKLEDGRVFRGVVNQQRLSFEAKCMDAQEDSCRTAHIVFRRRTSHGVAVAHVITRETPAHVVVEELSSEALRQRELVRLRDVLKKTASAEESQIMFMTSEVIGGRSEFAVVLRLDSKDPHGRLIGWQGPLVKAKGAAEIPGTIMVQQIVFKAQPVPTQEQRIVDETRLVRNDGRGNITLALGLGPKSGAKSREHQLLMTIARVHTPIKSME